MYRSLHRVPGTFGIQSQWFLNQAPALPSVAALAQKHDVSARVGGLPCLPHHSSWDGVRCK